MYQDVITLFNRYTTKDRKIIWYPTVLKDVNLNVDRASVIAKYGEKSQDNAILNVRYRIDDSQMMIGEKRWLPPKAWKNQDENTISGTITFSPSAQEFDFFYGGEWRGKDPIADDDYTGGFYAYMNRIYDWVYCITSVSKYILIPHFEVVAK